MKEFEPNSHTKNVETETIRLLGLLDLIPSTSEKREAIYLRAVSLLLLSLLCLAIHLQHWLFPRVSASKIWVLVAMLSLALAGWQFIRLLMLKRNETAGSYSTGLDSKLGFTTKKQAANVRSIRQFHRQR